MFGFLLEWSPQPQEDMSVRRLIDDLRALSILRGPWQALFWTLELRMLYGRVTFVPSSCRRFPIPTTPFHHIHVLQPGLLIENLVRT